MKPENEKASPPKFLYTRHWIVLVLIISIIVMLVPLTIKVKRIDNANREVKRTATAISQERTIAANNPPPQPFALRKNLIDGMIEIFIPAGNFFMGDPAENSASDRNSIPQRLVFLDAYWIAQTPVTNSMYNKCVDAGVCPKHTRQSLDLHYYDVDYANHPVVFINWNQAENYCQWTGGRLPTEAQWEKAARGLDDRDFPWGDIPPGIDQANIANYHDTTVDVGSFPHGASPFGVLDMGSNVREWVRDWYKDNYYEDGLVNPLGPETGITRVNRGAGWSDPVDFAKVTNRLFHEPNSPGWNRGFRCIYDA